MFNQVENQVLKAIKSDSNSKSNIKIFSKIFFIKNWKSTNIFGEFFQAYWQVSFEKFTSFGNPK